ncbi:MAG: Crp/Fnr family transcriptional regulator [Hyphomicrobiaceae bacterium]
MSDTIELLGKTRLFGALEPETLGKVARQLRPVSFKTNQQIFSRGDPGSELYLMLEGRVRLSIISLEGRELAFTHALAGDVFGEIATLDGGARTADATAVSPVKTLMMSRAQVASLVETSPRFARAAIDLLCQRLREGDQQLEVIALHRIEVRLARYLLSAVRQQHGDKPPADPLIRLGISQGELALVVGASRPKVNAALMMLEDTGAITRKGDGFVCNLDELAMIGEVG